MSKSCEDCKRILTKNEIIESRKKCISCRQSNQIKRLLSHENLSGTFSKQWSIKLLLRYNIFLENRKLSPITKRRNILCVIRVLALAERHFLIPGNITLEWLNTEPQMAKDIATVKASLFPFLVEEKILSPFTKGNIGLEKITKLIQRFPDSFRRLIQLYFEEMLSLREPPSTQALSFEELQRIARVIEESLKSKVLEALLSSLCFYHGLSPSQISKIKFIDVELDSKKLYVSGRPPVFFVK